MPRSLVLAVVLALTFAEGASAQPAAPTVPATADPPPAQMTERVLKTPERLQHRPSGFWTSNRPAQGGAYRYGKLLIGTGLVLVTGFLMFRIARRHARAPRPVWPTQAGSGSGHDRGNHAG